MSIRKGIVKKKVQKKKINNSRSTYILSPNTESDAILDLIPNINSKTCKNILKTSSFMDPVPMPTTISDQWQVVETEKVNISKWEKELFFEVVNNRTRKMGKGEGPLPYSEKS